MITEYSAKFIRDSPASVGHGLMLEILRSIERSLRDELGFLRAEASQVSPFVSTSPFDLTLNY